MFPEISARWSLFGRAECQIPVVTGQLGREEKGRPLDHVWQIPFFHSTLFIVEINFSINVELFAVISSVWYFQQYPGTACIRQLRMRPCWKTHLKAIIEVCIFHTVRDGAYWYKVHGICACVIDQQRNHQAFSAVLINFSYLLFCFASFLLLFCLFVSKSKIWKIRKEFLNNSNDAKIAHLFRFFSETRINNLINK